jgi:hypothetical protein
MLQSTYLQENTTLNTITHLAFAYSMILHLPQILQPKITA